MARGRPKGSKNKPKEPILLGKGTLSTFDYESIDGFPSRGLRLHGMGTDGADITLRFGPEHAKAIGQALLAPHGKHVVLRPGGTLITLPKGVTVPD